MSLWTVIKLLVACFVVGLLFAWLDTTPHAQLDKIWRAAADGAGTALRQLQALLGTSGQVVGYVLTGAVVVVPLWLLFWLLGAIRKRR
ncbi:MAG: hypothetical protein EA356_06075 [Geminicoccaceae bacterium]|nr:MAG: hypothetical protein EA356_06075 [Geminicoccaceae bacterium]